MNVFELAVCNSALFDQGYSTRRASKARSLLIIGRFHCRVCLFDAAPCLFVCWLVRSRPAAADRASHDLGLMFQLNGGRTCRHADRGCQVYP